ncbi:hypothetical protein SSOG_03291 [Streptomyces himastatinicus ATCC 53653]|uniref:Uncharacterized protein n=1 Tax=Streptomyces himastatinicus ATCC 53653 TaxID=457427 RepID=D9WK14_9ACTN|nr:hypothetical protein SSOG_03291 [Streptomyces himastatinicus ATCC 53653]
MAEKPGQRPAVTAPWSEEADGRGCQSQDAPHYASPAEGRPVAELAAVTGELSLLRLPMPGGSRGGARFGRLRAALTGRTRRERYIGLAHVDTDAIRAPTTQRLSGPGLRVGHGSLLLGYRVHTKHNSARTEGGTVEQGPNHESHKNSGS